MPGHRRGLAAAALVDTIANIGGLGCGPLFAGMLSHWAGAPLRLTFWVDLALLLPATVGVWSMPEPVRRPSRQQLWSPARCVPAGLRAMRH